MAKYVCKPERLVLSVLLVFSLISASHAQAQNVWTLESCIRHAHENNLNLRQQELNVEIARENLTQVASERFPNLNFNATHGYNHGRTVDPFTNEFATERVRSNNFSVSSGMVLFNGFQISNAIKQSRLMVDASRHDVEAVKNDISLAIASAYLEILLFKELIEVMEGQLEITRQQAERTKKFFEAGRVPRGNLLTIEAQAATEELQLINTQNNLQMAYINLAHLLDLREIDDFRIEIPDIEIDPGEITDMSPAEIYNIAVRIHPDVKASQIRVLSAEKDVEIARGGRYPMLSLRGAYGTGYSGASLEVIESTIAEPKPIGYTESGETVFVPTYDYQTQIIPFADQLENNRNRSIGLYLTIPVFNNFQTRSAINRTKVALESSKLSNRLVRDQVFKTIQQSHADAKASLKKYEATKKNAGALEESFRYTEQRFNVGMADPIEYNDAKNRLAAAESELLQAKYEFVFRIKILDFYMGNPIKL